MYVQIYLYNYLRKTEFENITLNTVKRYTFLRIFINVQTNLFSYIPKKKIENISLYKIKLGHGYSKFFVI